MNFDWTEVLTASMILFAVIDIVGSIPVIIEIKKKSGVVNPLKATLVAGGIMLMILFVGEQIIHLIGIDINSFAVAGSFVLLFLALEMILGIRLFREEDVPPQTASVVPLAFPLIAGAGTMTSILSIRAEFATINICAAIAINMIFVYIVLRSTTKIETFLGDGGIAILKKIFGIVLLAIAVKLFSANVKVLFQ